MPTIGRRHSPCPKPPASVPATAPASLSEDAAVLTAAAPWPLEAARGGRCRPPGVSSGSREPRAPRWDGDRPLAPTPGRASLRPWPSHGSSGSSPLSPAPPSPTPPWLSRDTTRRTSLRACTLGESGALAYECRRREPVHPPQRAQTHTHTAGRVSNLDGEMRWDTRGAPVDQSGPMWGLGLRLELHCSPLSSGHPPSPPSPRHPHSHTLEPHMHRICYNGSVGVACEQRGCGKHSHTNPTPFVVLCNGQSPCTTRTRPLAPYLPVAPGPPARWVHPRVQELSGGWGARCRHR